MKGIFRSILVSSLVLGVSGSCLIGGVEVIVQVNSSSTALVPGVRPEPATVVMASVRLENDWLAMEDEKANLVFDRAGDRLLTLRPAIREYEASSLFAIFEYRAETYRGILGLEDRGYRPSVHGTGNPEVIVDHIFGLTNPAGAPLPVVAETAGRRRWSTGDQLLAGWTTKGTPLTADQMELFAFWLRQTSGGHPVILRDLVEGGRVPEEIEIFLNDGEVLKTVTIDLVGVRPVPDEDLGSRLEGWSRQTAGARGDAFAILLDWIVSRGEFAASIAAEANADDSRATAAFEDGDPIRGILETVRVQMMTGQTPELELESRSEMIRQSRTATNLATSLSASNPEAYAEAVQTFDVLRDALEDQAAVLKILTAENLVRLNRLALAERTLREAVMADPSLAIAFKNLGDIMRATGRYPLGWLCYEAFAVVSPNHPENRQIEETKTIILRDFPDFF